MKNNGLLLIGGAVAAILLFQSRAFQNFKDTMRVAVSSLRFNAQETGKALYARLVMDLVLQIANPTNFEGTLSALKIGVYFQGKLLTMINTTRSIKLAPQSSTNLPLQIAVNTLQIFGTTRAMLDAFRDKTGIQLQLKGTALTSAGSIPIDQTVKVL